MRMEQRRPLKHSTFNRPMRNLIDLLFLAQNFNNIYTGGRSLFIISVHVIQDTKTGGFQVLKKV